MTKQTTHFMGSLTTTSALHIADPEPARMKDDGTLTNSDQAKNLVRTTREPILIDTFEEDGDGNMVATGKRTQEYPVINANCFRGFLHRECADVLFKHLIATGGTISRGLTSALMCGASSGLLSKETKSKRSFIMAGRENLYSGLWGGGPSLLTSGLITPPLHVICDDMVENRVIPGNWRDFCPGVVPANSNQYNGMFTKGLTYPLTIHRNDDLLGYTHKNIESVIDDYEKTLENYISGVIDGRVERKNGKGENKAKKKDLANMISFELVPIGMPFFIDLSVKEYISEAQVGLMLMVLNNAKLGTLEGSLGGKRNLAMGQFEIDLHPYFCDENGKKKAYSDAEIDSAIGAAKNAIELISPEELEDIYVGKAA